MRVIIVRAMCRNDNAASTINGAISIASSASRQLTHSNTPAMITTSSSWLSRSITRVTTVEKSCVSDVTRLTILPDENSS